MESALDLGKDEGRAEAMGEPGERARGAKVAWRPRWEDGMRQVGTKEEIEAPELES